MLQTIGKHIQGWIAGVVIAIVSAAFVLFGLEYYISRGASDKKSVVATVNGRKIFVKQLDSTYENLQRNYTQQGLVLDEQMQQQLRSVSLQQLILEQALLQTAQKMGLAINTAQVQQEILQIPAFQEKGQFSPQKFQQLLSSHGLTPEGFIQNVQSSLLVEQLSSGIQNSNFVTPSELAQVYGFLEQQRSFGYFLLPGAPFIAEVRPTDQEITAYYQQYQNQFRTPEQVKVAYLLLSPESIKSEVTVNPADVAQFYQDNAGEFSGKSFESVKANIEQRLYQQQLNQVLAAKSEQLEDLTYTNPSSLNEAAKALGLEVKLSGLMSRQGIKNDPLFADPKVLSVVFSDEVMKQNNNSQPVELKDGSFLVVRIAQHQLSQNQPLETVRDAIKQRLQKEAGQKKAGMQAYEIQHALETGQSIDSLAKQYHLTWITKTLIKRQDKSVVPQLLTTVFSIAPNRDPAKKAVTSVLLANGDYAIVQLEGLHDADFTQASSVEQEKLRAGLAAHWGELDYQLFTKSVLDKAKIEKLISSNSREL